MEKEDKEKQSLEAEAENMRSGNDQISENIRPIELGEKTIKALALELQCLEKARQYAKSRNEISTSDICKHYKVSRQTIWRKKKYGVLPHQVKKHGKNFYSYAMIEKLDIEGRL